MIDTCKFFVVLTDAVRVALRAAQHETQPAVKIYAGHFYVKHPYGLPSFKVSFNLTRGELWLELSLPKVLQGHNVFGSNRLQILCLSVIKLIYAQLGIKFTRYEVAEIREYGIRLGRLDITCSFRLESPAMVDLVLEYIYEHSRAEGKAWSAYGRDSVESVYNQLHSTRVTDKYYNKMRELLVMGRGIPTAVPQRARILDMVRYFLRFEVTFRAKELTSLGLEYADCWNPRQVKAELRARLEQFNFRGVIRPILDTDELPGLNDSCRTFYRLWAEGANLKKHQGYRTLDRARRTLLEHHQIDIYRRAKTGCPISLAKALNQNNTYYFAPKLLVRSGAIFNG